MTATMPRDSGIGTGQPAHVMLGESARTAAGNSDRWTNTACRMGPTT